MSLFVDYFLEEEKKDVLEKEYGFITYHISNKECFVADVFIRKEERGKKHALSLLSEVAAIASKKGCEFLTGLCTFDRGESERYTTKVRLMLEAGFRIVSVKEGQLVFYKKLEV